MDKLKQAILELISELYCKKYIGPLHVKLLHNHGWDCVLGLDTYDKPIHIAADLDEDDFLKYIKEELRHRRLADEHFYTGYKTDLDCCNMPFRGMPLERHQILTYKLNLHE